MVCAGVLALAGMLRLAADRTKWVLVETKSATHPFSFPYTRPVDVGDMLLTRARRG